MSGDGPERHGQMGQTAERAAGRAGNCRTVAGVTGAAGGPDEAGERPKSGRSGRTAPEQRPLDRTTTKMETSGQQLERSDRPKTRKAVA